MPNEPVPIYWDAPVWLSYINGEDDRLPVLDAILADSSSDKATVKIHTSTVSQVEVAFAKTEEDNKSLDPDVEEKIDQLWADRNTLQVLEFHAGIGTEARNLMRSAVANGWKLKPMDAIHLATAKSCKAAEFQTYDKHLLKYSGSIGLPIVIPHTQKPRLFELPKSPKSKGRNR